MFYCNLDEDGWLLSVSTTPMPGCPSVESLDGLDLSGMRMGAYRWTGTGLALDEDRLASLAAEQTAAERAAWERDEQERARYEVQTALIAAQINSLPADDDTALRWRGLYPAWTAGTAYEAGVRVRHGEKLYRCRQGHTAQAGWEPAAAASLWSEVGVNHAGTAEDPIPYGGNMALEAGKFYVQNGITYRCTRDTGMPVYHPLAALTGLYVEAA